MQPSIKKNYIYNLIYQLILVIVPIITMPYVSRVLKADGIGAFSFTTAITGYFVLIGNLGIATYGQLKIATLRDDKHEMSKLFYELFLLRTGLTLVLVCAFVAFIELDGGEYKSLYYVLIFQILAASIDVAWFLQGLEEFKKIVIRNTIIKIISVVCIFVFVKKAEDLWVYAFILNFSTFIGNLSIWLFIPKYVQKVHIKELKIFQHVLPCLKYFIPTVATTLYLTIDKTMIGWFTDSTFENGYYEQAQKIEQMVVTVVTSLSIVTMPRMAYLYKNNELGQFKNNLNQTIRFILFMSVPMCLGLVAIASYLIPLYLGKGYDKSIELLQIFSVLIIIVGLNNAVGKQVLMATGRQNKYNVSVIIGAVVNIVLNVILIPFFMAKGAAIASVIAEFVILLAFIFFARDFVNVFNLIKCSVKYILSGALMFIVIIVLNHWLSIRWLSIVLQVSAGIAVYFISVIILHDKLVFDAMKAVKGKMSKKMSNTNNSVNTENQLSVAETQKISLEILYQISKICDENNFRYMLVYGTLIGAVRHQGFIPWDDDVDIMMPRPDYDNLLKYLKEHIVDFPNLKVFNCEECEEYPYMITRISDDRYKIIVDNETQYGIGVFIDIYPYDGLGETKKEALKLGLRGDRLSSLCFQATRNHFAIGTTKSFFRKLIKFPVYLYAKLRGKNHYQKKLKKLVGIKSYDESNFVGCVVWLSGGEKDIFPREWFDEVIKIKFEDYEFNVPKEYDKILKHIYGDYMQLPPEVDRVGHHFYKVYEK